jgi:hypothetical protein
MRKARLITVFGAALALASAPAHAAEAPAADPVLGERIVDGAATRARLWLLNDKGAVVAFDRGAGKKTVLATEGVRDILRAGGVTVALRTAPDGAGALVVTDLETGAALTPTVRGEAAALARAGADWVVLAKDAVLRSDGGPWRREPYKPFDRRGFGGVVAAALPDGSVYVGLNHGEWGGGLWRLTRGSEEAVRVEAVNEPVTAVIADPDRPGCVLAATGLIHIVIARGAVTRVCGSTAEIVFEKALEDSGNGPPMRNLLPIFGLARGAEGWIAVAPGQVVTSERGAVRVVPMPPLQPWSSLRIAESEGALFLLTDANWAHSVSGYTPLLIPVTP